MNRILIVDDDPDTAESFARILEHAGYEVARVFDGESALLALAAKDSRFHGVVVDLHMPGVDGLAFLRRLRHTRDGRDMPVTVVTGNYLMADRTETELSRLGAIIRFKPLLCEDLVEIARTLVATPHDGLTRHP